MSHLRIAVATRCLKLPLRASLKAAADCGAQGVQFDLRDELRLNEFSETGLRQLKHQIDELRLRVASATFPTRRGLADEQQLDARIAAIRAAMEFAWQLRAPVLTIRPGKLPGEVDSPEYRLLHDVISDLARHANRVGVTLAMTPAGDAPESLAAFAASIKSGPVGIDFDPASFVVARCRPEAAWRQLYALVSHLTIRDAVRDSDGGGTEVPVGRGEVDWIELLPLVDEAAYPGWATVIRTHGDDRAGDVIRAVEFLKNVGLS